MDSGRDDSLFLFSFISIFLTVNWCYFEHFCIIAERSGALLPYRPPDEQLNIGGHTNPDACAMAKFQSPDDTSDSIFFALA